MTAFQTLFAGDNYQAAFEAITHWHQSTETVPPLCLEGDYGFGVAWAFKWWCLSNSAPNLSVDSANDFLEAFEQWLDQQVDWIWLAPESSHSSIGIDVIRQLMSDTSLSATVSKHRIVVIHQPETLTLAASNAILKWVESPPKHTRIVMLTEQPSRILPTIYSRVVNIRLGAAATSYEATRAVCPQLTALHWHMSGQTPFSALESMLQGAEVDFQAALRAISLLAQSANVWQIQEQWPYQTPSATLYFWYRVLQAVLTENTEALSHFDLPSSLRSHTHLPKWMTFFEFVMSQMNQIHIGIKPNNDLLVASCLKEWQGCIVNIKG